MALVSFTESIQSKFKKDGPGSIITDTIDYLVASPSPIRTERITNNAFQLRVESTRNKGFKCKLPDTLNFALSSKFSSLVEGKLGIVSSLNKILSATSGLSGSSISLNTKYTTAQLWEGSTPISIKIPLELNAREDVDKEVLIPMLRLSSMVLPSEGNETGTASLFNSMLRAPGPAPIDYKQMRNEIQSTSWGKKALNAIDEFFGTNISSLDIKNGGDDITIYIGKFMTFKKCIIPDVTWDIDLTRLLYGSGKPMSVKGSMTFRTSTAMTTNDFKEIMHENSIKDTSGIIDDIITYFNKDS